MKSIQSQSLDSRILGKALLSPSRAVAGSFVTVNYRYHVDHPIDDSGYIKIAFRFAGDAGTPQFTQPSEANYCSVSTTGDCRIIPRWDAKGHTRPWGKTLYLKITAGYLDKGDAVKVVFGDTSGGSSGWQMQTFCESTFEFKTLVDPIASYQFKELPKSPTLKIVPGKAAKAVCIAPSEVRQNRSFYYHLKLEDIWGNPVSKPKKIRHSGFKESGFFRVIGKDAQTGLSAVSNPIRVVECESVLRPYWADFHGQSEETIGSNSIEDYLSFARDKALLDISGHQGNDFQVTDAFWDKINTLSDDYTAAGRFVVFPGYEWSGNTPLGGDRNVYFSTNRGKIARSSNDLLPDNASKYPVSATADELFKALKKQGSAKPFSFAHVGGRFADMSMHDPDIETAVEIHSAWGTFEWLLTDALKHGYRVGICANSDGHKCRPGASYPGASKFGSYGGLTCVLAKTLDRESIYDAMKKRHFYATTGHRCLMDVQLDYGVANAAMMGDVVELQSATPVLYGKAVGTAPIEAVEIYNGGKIVKTIRPYSKADLGNRIKVIWSGAEVRGRDRKVEWDGGLRVKGNSIVNVEPINFWNVEQPLNQVSSSSLQWQSITTGGLSGCIIGLKRSGGKLVVETKQGKVSCDINAIGLTPKVRHFGGLEKKITIQRLADKMQPCQFDFRLALKDLHKGDNPIYIKVMQEDGHLVWSSPLYIMKK